MKQYTFILASDNLTLYHNGNTYEANSDHVNYNKILKRIRKGYKSDKQAAKLIKLFDTTEAVKSYLNGNIEITEHGQLLYKSNPIDNVLVSKILDMQRNGFNIDPMVKFLDNLLDNPSYSAQQELMLFMEANQMPITDDGHFLAYKSVRSDYKDSYSGNFDNSIGAVCEMPRGAVNDDRTQTCSNGLHFAAKEYAGGFCQGHLMVLKINPRDVVSIPNDYNNQKGRCCRYEVIDEVPQATSGADNYNTKVVHESSDCDPDIHQQFCIECGISLSECDVQEGECPTCGTVL